MALFGECKFGTFEFGVDELCGEIALLISPNLGNPNRISMLDPYGTNPTLSIWLLSQLEQVLTPPSYLKGPDSLIFERGGVYFKLPKTAMQQFGAPGKHFFRFDTGFEQDPSPIDTFIFVRNAPGVDTSAANGEDRVLN